MRSLVFVAISGYTSVALNLVLVAKVSLLVLILTFELMGLRAAS